MKELNKQLLSPKERQFEDWHAYQGATVTRNKTFPIDVFKGGRNLFSGIQTVKGFLSSAEGSIVQSESMGERTSDFIPIDNLTNSYVCTRYRDKESSFGAWSAYVLYDENKVSLGVRPAHYNDIELGDSHTFPIRNDGIYANAKYIRISSRGLLDNTFKIKFELGSTPTEYSPAPEDGYDYEGPNPAYHIQISGGTDNIRYLKSLGVMQGVDLKYGGKFYNFSNEHSFRVVAPSISPSTNYIPRQELYEVNLSGVTSAGATQYRIVSNALTDNLDFIASDPSILIDYSYTMDTVSNLTIRTVTTFIEQRGQRFYPLSANFVQKTDSLVGDFVTDAVAFKINSDALLGFDHSAHFDVYVEIKIPDDGDQNLIADENITHIGEYLIDVEESKFDSNARMFELVGLISMDKFKEKFTYDVSGGTTPEMIMETLSESLGISFDLIKLPGITDTPMEKFNYNVDEFITIGQVIQAYAHLTLSNAYYDGFKVYYKSPLNYHNTYNISYNDVVGEIGEYEMYNLIGIKYDAIGGVDDPISAKIPNVEGEQFYFSDNLFINSYDRENQIELIEDITELISYYTGGMGLTYAGIELKDLYINPSRTLGDYVVITTRDGYTIPTFIQEFNYSYTPALKGTLKCDRIETVEDFYRNMDDTKRGLLSMGVKVNRHDEEIRAYIESTDEQLRQLVTDITLIPGQITSSVRELREELVGDELVYNEETGEYDDLGGILGAVESNINQTIDDISLEFTHLVEGVDGKVEEWRTFYKFDKDELTIGKNLDALSIAISNAQIDFKNGDTVTAYINGEVMYINSLEVLESIVLGHHKISKYNGALKSTIWKMT